MKPIKEIKALIAKENPRSKWRKGVCEYANDLLDELASRCANEHRDPCAIKDHMALRSDLLNGADGWRHYSFSASALVYDEDIAERLLTPSEFARWERRSQRDDYDGKELLEDQGRALAQAFGMISSRAF